MVRAWWTRPKVLARGGHLVSVAVASWDQLRAIFSVLSAFTELPVTG